MAGDVGASHVSTATLSASGNVNVNGKLIVGTDGASQNGLYFAGTANDGTNHSVILNRLYDASGGAGQSIDCSEILLFQGNDSGSPDRIRSVAGAHQWQIYTGGVAPTDTATFWGENNYVTAMYIAPSTGNVGINTKSPAHTLDVNGTLRSTGNVTAPTFVGSLSGNAQSANVANRLTLETFNPVSIDGNVMAFPLPTTGAISYTFCTSGVEQGIVQSRIFGMVMFPGAQQGANITIFSNNANGGFTDTSTVDYSRLYLSSIHKGYNWTVKYVPMIF